MKESVKTKKIVRVLVAAMLLDLAGIGFCVWLAWLWNQPKFHDVTVELGSDSNTINIRQFMTLYAVFGENIFTSDISNIDTSQVGHTQVTLRHGQRQEETVTLTVKDTTPPEVTFFPVRTQPIGYVPEPDDFVASCFDLSETTVSFEGTVVIPENCADVALTVLVADESGNTTKGDCVLRFTGMLPSYTMELGDTLTPEDLLIHVEKDKYRLDQAQIDAVNRGGAGEYSVTGVSASRTTVCTVRVRDTTPPSLELKDVRVREGQRVSPEDFVANAWDASGKVKLRFAAWPDTSKDGTQTVTIEASDPYGNVASAQAALRVHTDRIPPVISGLEPMTAAKQTTPDYLSGVTAKDETDGICTVSCDASGVNMNKPGVYYAVYTTRDKTGNTATAKRQIEVVPAPEDIEALVEKMARDAGTNDPEKLRDFVRDYIKYNQDWGGNTPVWYGFTKRVGNCYVHAVCLDALLQHFGYETRLIWTTDKTHYWLLIQLGGEWKHIDPTPSQTHGKYSLMNDEQRLSTLKERAWDFTAWPACP